MKKKKTFRKLMESVKDDPEVSYETVEEEVKRFESYLPYYREYCLKEGKLLLSMKIDGRMYYKLATGHKKDKKWIIKALLQYKCRIAGAKQKGRKERAQVCYNRVLEIIKEKKLLDEDTIKNITEGGVKWMEEYLAKQDWAHELTEEQKKDNEIRRQDKLAIEIMDEANKKMEELKKIDNSLKPGLPSSQKMLLQLDIIGLLLNKLEDARDEEDKLMLRKKLAEEQKKWIKLADEIIKEAKEIS